LPPSSACLAQPAPFPSSQWTLQYHQEKPSAIIAGCGVYNSAANCDPVVTTAIRLESVCSSAGRLRPDLDRITQNMSLGHILPGHVLVHFAISHRPIAFSQISLLRLSHSDHHHTTAISCHLPPTASYCLPRDCVAFLTA
jgi:hypothetical protein